MLTPRKHVLSIESNMSTRRRHGTQQPVVLDYRFCSSKLIRRVGLVFIRPKAVLRTPRPKAVRGSGSPTHRSTLESKVAQRTAQLQQRARQLAKLTLEISETEDRERRRMAEILHDDLQQELAAAKFQVSVLRGRAKSDASLQAIAAGIEKMLKTAIEKSRSLSHELSPAVMHRGDFGETFRWLAARCRPSTAWSSTCRRRAKSTRSRRR